MDKFLCVLGVFDRETERMLAEYQQAVFKEGFTGRQTMGIPFHVTLGTYAPTDGAMLQERVRELEMPPVEVQFNHMGLFQGQEVLFLAPDVNRELLDLKEAFGVEKGWTAHTTMLIDSRQNCLRAAEVLGECFRRFSGRIDRVELYEFFPAKKLSEKILG